MIDSKSCHKGRNHTHRAGRGFRIALIVAVITFAGGCSSPTVRPTIVRPKVAPMPQPERQLLRFKLHEKLMSFAPDAVKNTDPAVCLAQGVSDPREIPLGGRTSIAPYTFSTQPHIQDMYATLYIETDICTSQTLSSSDESRLQRVLNVFKISKAQSFIAKLSLRGDGQGGITYPQIVPFSYSFDTKTNKYNVSTTSVGVIPWQETTGFDITWSYDATKTVSIGTADLFTNLVTAVAGAGGASSLLSPAANGYLSAGNMVTQDVAAALSNTTFETDHHHFDLKQGPDSPARSVTFRFRDLNNRPLAGVRIAVGFTDSLLTQDVVDPTKDDSKHIPDFSKAESNEIPPIVNVTVAGPSSGPQTLLQEISKDQNYQDLLKTTADTSKESFRNDCDNFENDLQTVYGLNKYDSVLTMAYVLSQDTPYLAYKKFYSSCFVPGRSVLKAMGITVFDTKPSS